VSLPFPPSVNNLFLNLKRGGRVPTPRYLLWQARAAEALRDAVGVPGSFTAHLQFQRPSRRAYDLDNLAKAPLDALKKAGVIVDDSLAQRIVLEWADSPPHKDAQVVIWLTAM
jgi:Holliday junction resolvase RusA-like endonuclease